MQPAPTSLFTQLFRGWFALLTQQDLDEDRRTYKLAFPSELNAEDVLHWLRHISASLHTPSNLLALPTIVFEVVATDRAINHYVTIPRRDAEYIVAQLQGLVPGIGVAPVSGRERPRWLYAEEFDMYRPGEAVEIPNVASLSTSILLTLGHLEPKEALGIQWILSPLHRKDFTDGQLEVTTFDPKTMQFKSSGDKARIASRRAKATEPNYLAALRIAGFSKTPRHAEMLVANTYRPIKSLGVFKRAFVLNRTALIERARLAASPSKYGCQLNAKELVPLICWPLGAHLIPGISRGATRHMPATESVPYTGRVLGITTMPGRERQVAVDYTSALTHTFIGGSNGVGKTTLMANMARQDMEAGKGVIVIEAKGDLFYETINNVPPHRMDDVIVIDFTDGLRPVGFNILDQGNPRTVVDELVELFQYKYKDNGVWFRELMFHGLLTLAATPGMTFNDLRALVAPKDETETAWAKAITDNMTDRELIHFWNRWWSKAMDGDRTRNAQPLENRVWQLISRIEPRYLFGQGTSSFKMDDVVRGNKILLVNLAGVPKESKEIVGTLLFNALWSSVQNMKPVNENFVYMDEFQMFADLPMGLDDVLALARKYKLGMVAATQYVERLPSHLQLAVKANMRNKVIMNSGEESASIWSREFGRNAVTVSDIINLPAYKAVARVNTPDGVSNPFTIATLPPKPPYNSRQVVATLSMNKYGRSVKDIEQAELERRAYLAGRRKVADMPPIQRRDPTAPPTTTRRKL